MKWHLLPALVLLTLCRTVSAPPEPHPALHRDPRFLFFSTNVNVVSTVLLLPDSGIVLGAGGHHTVPWCLDSDGLQLSIGDPSTNFSFAIQLDGTALTLNATNFMDAASAAAPSTGGS